MYYLSSFFTCVCLFCPFVSRGTQKTLYRFPLNSGNSWNFFHVDANKNPDLADLTMSL